MYAQSVLFRQDPSYPAFRSLICLHMRIILTFLLFFHHPGLLYRQTKYLSDLQQRSFFLSSFLASPKYKPGLGNKLSSSQRTYYA